jgi:chorismate lyase/3-hydroxybenzoate synthase
MAGGPFAVHFGRTLPEGKSDAPSVVGLPLLSGIDDEVIFPPAIAVGRQGGFAVYQCDDWLLGHAAVPVARGQIERATAALYQDLLTVTRGKHLCRVWNYVPQINAEEGGFENYRAFCRGRANAFEVGFGDQQFARLSAASAVGSNADRLTVIFAAAGASPRHWENPEQIAAYRYPAEHGPRAPSFARATVTADGRYVFISGTSAIKGHATMSPGDTAGQVDCTLDNLALISATAGLGRHLGADAAKPWERHFKIYLRHAGDLSSVKARLDAELLRPGDRVTWLQADICRAALNVEIEATLVAR